MSHVNVSDSFAAHAVDVAGHADEHAALRGRENRKIPNRWTGRGGASDGRVAFARTVPGPWEATSPVALGPLPGLGGDGRSGIAQLLCSLDCLQNIVESRSRRGA